MSHYRTEVYDATKLRLESASVVAAERVFVERNEPIAARTAAQAATELPIVNLAFQRGSRSRDTDAAPLKGTAVLDVEVLATGESTEEAAANRDDLVENIEAALFNDPLAWSSNRWKVLSVDETVGQSRDADVLVSACKLSLTLEIATVPEVDTEDMVEGVDVDVQTMEPDDDSTEMSFLAEPDVGEEA